jgi:hypothetical protein
VGPDHFIKFQMHRLGIAVLGVLNQENHQESHDSSPGIYDQLPGIGKMKGGAGERPRENDQDCADKSPGRAENNCGSTSEAVEGIPYQAEKIVFFFLFGSTQILLHDFTLSSHPV